MPGASVVRRAADAITNLAHENVSIKSRVRAEGGIPPLVALLQAYDAKVSLAASPHWPILVGSNQRRVQVCSRQLAAPDRATLLDAHVGAE